MKVQILSRPSPISGGTKRHTLYELNGHWVATGCAPDTQHARSIMDAQIKHMAERFLGWRLPEDFNPDGGITFKAVYNEGSPYEGRHQPVGTNLFDYTQAAAMVRHMIEGLPGAEQVPGG